MNLSQVVGVDMYNNVSSQFTEIFSRLKYDELSHQYNVPDYIRVDNRSR